MSVKNAYRISKSREVVKGVMNIANLGHVLFTPSIFPIFLPVKKIESEIIMGKREVSSE